MGRTKISGRAGLAVLLVAGALSLGAGARLQAASRPVQVTPELSVVMAHFEAGRYDRARVELVNAIARAPRDAALYHWLGRTYLQMGDDDQAIANAQEAVALAPETSEYHRWLGRAYGDKADRTRSFWLARKVKGEFERAVELDPANIAARLDLMEFYLDAPWVVGGGHGKARDQVEAIAALDAVQGDLARATYLIDDGRTDQAAAAYGRVLAMRPSEADPYFEAAAFYVHRRNTGGLEAAIAGAGRVAPSDRRLDFYRGVAEVLAGARAGSAETWLLSYLSAAPSGDNCPSPASAHLWLGRFYEHAGRVDAAIAQYQQVLQLVPDQQAARDALDRLRSAR